MKIGRIQRQQLVDSIGNHQCRKSRIVGRNAHHTMATYKPLPFGERCVTLVQHVGQLFHDEPNIMHFGVPGTGVELKPGMIFTIEPMINLGRPHVKILSDGWTAVTRDRTLSAQAEHSIGITETGAEIFTLSPRGLFNPLDAHR